MTATQLQSDEIGAIIRRRRLALDATKSEMARRAGVSRRTWHEIEEGQRRGSSQETLSLFEQALGLDPGELFALTTKPVDREVEHLRRRFVDLASTLGLIELRLATDQLEAIVNADTQGELRRLRAELEELHRVVAERLPPDAGDDGRDRGAGQPRRRRPRRAGADESGADERPTKGHRD